MSGIENQLAYYNANKADINKNYAGKYIVIDDTLSINSFDTLSEAYNFGVSTVGLGNFMLKHIESATTDSVHYVNPTIAVL